MKLNFAIAALLLSAAPVLAASDTWTAEMQEDEGGPVMTAWVDGTGAAGDAIPPAIRIMCFDEVSFRFDPGVVAEGEGAMTPGNEADLLLKTDKAELTRHALYEDMDGALAVYVPKDDALIDMLRTGATIDISVPERAAFPVRTFTLKGSSAALATLFASCP
jgi:hypothetical protein